MSEFVNVISQASNLAGFCASILISFACWRLFLIERGRLLLAASISSAISLVIFCLYNVPWILLSAFPQLWNRFQWFYDAQALWSALVPLSILSMLVTLLSLARWFFLSYRQQSAESGV